MTTETTTERVTAQRVGLQSPGVHTALSVLEALVVEAPLGLSELASRLAVPKSSLSRVCSILVQRGWVIRDQTGRYDLGIRAVGLSPHATEYPLVRAFRTVAPDLLAQHNETVCLAVLDGDHSTFIAMEDSSHPVRLVTHVGSRTPAFASASGRVILADRAAHVVSAEYAGRPLVTPAGRRLRGVEELLEILEAVRRDGYAENREETAIGLHAISVPIRNSVGAVLAALTICAPTSRMKPGRRDQILQDVRDSGERLSEGVAWLAAWNATRAEPSRVRAARPQPVEDVDSWHRVVDPAQRRKGVGRALARWAVLEAARLGLSKVYVEVVAGQEPAIIMFQNLGFAAEALLKDHIQDRHGHPHDLVILSQSLADSYSAMTTLGLDTNWVRIMPLVEARRAAESSGTLVRWMGVTDANLSGFVHGGIVMRLCDEVAALAAIRHSRQKVVTAAVDRMTFLHNIQVGELLILTASVNAAWRSSMEVGVLVEAENPQSGQRRHTNSAYLTMVAVDDSGRPIPIPPLLTETSEEQRREREAQLRRRNRLAERDQIMAARD